MTRLVLLDFNPAFCSCCGDKVKFNRSEFEEARQTLACANCGTAFQRGDSNVIRQAATQSGGDMATVIPDDKTRG